MNEELRLLAHRKRLLIARSALYRLEVHREMQALWRSALHTRVSIAVRVIVLAAATWRTLLEAASWFKGFGHK